VKAVEHMNREDRHSSEAQHDKINELLGRDGWEQISRASFFRWKRLARELYPNCLDFRSSAWRKRDRSRFDRERPGKGRRVFVRATPIPPSKLSPIRSRKRKVSETLFAPPRSETPFAPKPYKDQTPKGDLLDPRVIADSEREEGRGASMRQGSPVGKGRPRSSPPSHPNRLEWNPETRTFDGDLEAIREKLLHRYGGEFGRKWINAVWHSTREWAEDNPEKLKAKRDHSRFIFDWFRREAKEKRGGGPWTPRDQAVYAEAAVGTR